MYSGCYGLGFGVTLPVYFMASVLRPLVTGAHKEPRNAAATADSVTVEKEVNESSATTSTASSTYPPSPALMPA